MYICTYVLYSQVPSKYHKYAGSGKCKYENLTFKCGAERGDAPVR